MIEALGLISRHANAGNTTYFSLGETVPAYRGLAGDWQELVYRADTRGRRRVVRTAYEVATFQALRDALRCKEIWVPGADRWRNPDEDAAVVCAESFRGERATKWRRPRWLALAASGPGRLLGHPHQAGRSDRWRGELSAASSRHASHPSRQRP